MELQCIAGGITRLVNDFHAMKAARKAHIHCTAAINEEAVSYPGNPISFTTSQISRRSWLPRFTGARG